MSYSLIFNEKLNYYGGEVIMEFGYMSGWVCPLCGRVYSPYQDTCPYCNCQDTTITTGTGTGDVLPKESYNTSVNDSN